MTKLILGTAQFGAGYGITNGVGRITDERLRAMMSLASDSGVDTFDTAADYGDSQQRLGRLTNDNFRRRYITKFSLPDDHQVAPTPELLYSRSKRTLDVDSLEGVLFHHVSDLTDARCSSAVEILRSAREAGEVKRIGVSIYDSDDLELALRNFPDLDLLQFPGNVIDRRLLDLPRISELRDSGVEVHVRSAFLQGLLLSSPNRLPEFFAPLVPVLNELAAHAARTNSTVLSLALRFLKNHPVVDGVVVGATSTTELTTIVTEWNIVEAVQTDFTVELPARLLDPRIWPQVKVL